LFFLVSPSNVTFLLKTIMSFALCTTIINNNNINILNRNHCSRSSKSIVRTNAKKDKRKQERALLRKQDVKSRTGQENIEEEEEEEEEVEEDNNNNNIENNNSSENKDKDNDTINTSTSTDKYKSIIESKEVFFQSMSLASTYKQRTDLTLLGEQKIKVTEAVEKLFFASFVCCSHDEFDRFNYANKAALQLWEMEWDEFVGLPSTKSADVEDVDVQNERRKLLDEALEKGVVYNYDGVRKSKSGKEFRIKDATLWTMVDRDGDRIGQAVKFSRVEYVDSKEVFVVAEGGDWVKFVENKDVDDDE
jgi:hypothetical protein